MKNNGKKEFLTKEEGLKIFKKLKDKGFIFNGDMEYYMESFNKDVPSEDDQVCTIPLRYVGWDNDAKQYYVFTRFMLVSKKDIEKALVKPRVYKDIFKEFK